MSKSYTEDGIEGLEAALSRDVVLVDVRSPEEYAAGHVPAALNIPVVDVPSRLDELRTLAEGELWVICKSGGRSSRVANYLAGEGVRCTNVAGGTLAWHAAGKPLA